MRAVLDTNVLISAVIATGIPHEVLVSGFEGEYTLVVSEPTVREFRQTLLKYPDRFQMDESEIRTEVETIRYFAEFVVPDEGIAAVDADPDDDKFLEVSVAGSVDYLVSGDEHLLTLESHRGRHRHASVLLRAVIGPSRRTLPTRDGVGTGRNLTVSRCCG